MKFCTLMAFFSEEFKPGLKFGVSILNNTEKTKKLMTHETNLILFGSYHVTCNRKSADTRWRIVCIISYYIYLLGSQLE